MYSADFLKKFAQLQQQQVNQAATAPTDSTVTAGESSDPVEPGVKMVGSRPSAYANAQPSPVQTTVYDPMTGKAYPNPGVATSEGVTNFSHQIPSGMTVDWSYWDRFAQPEPTPVTATETVVADQTLPFNPPAPAPKPEPTPRPAPPVVEQAAAVVQPAPPVVHQRVQASAPPPPPPPPPPVEIASRAEWENQGTYMHGAGHSGPNSGESLKGDRNNDNYYANYVNSMNKANSSGQFDYAREINRAHSLKR
jgi:hypothetical protein